MVDVCVKQVLCLTVARKDNYFKCPMKTHVHVFTIMVCQCDEDINLNILFLKCLQAIAKVKCLGMGCQS